MFNAIKYRLSQLREKHPRLPVILAALLLAYYVLRRAIRGVPRDYMIGNLPEDIPPQDRRRGRNLLLGAFVLMVLLPVAAAAGSIAPPVPRKNGPSPLAGVRLGAPVVSTSTMSRERANTMLFRPRLTACFAMRVVCERAEARMPRSGLTTGGFHSSSRRSPRGAPLRVMAETDSPISMLASDSGLAIVAEHNTN